MVMICSSDCLGFSRGEEWEPTREPSQQVNQHSRSIQRQLNTKTLPGWLAGSPTDLISQLNIFISLMWWRPVASTDLLRTRSCSHLASSSRTVSMILLPTHCAANDANLEIQALLAVLCTPDSQIKGLSKDTIVRNTQDTTAFKQASWCVAEAPDRYPGQVGGASGRALGVQTSKNTNMGCPTASMSRRSRIGGSSANVDWRGWLTMTTGS
jgi:hypothetical protein